MRQDRGQQGVGVVTTNEISAHTKALECVLSPPDVYRCRHTLLVCVSKVHTARCTYGLPFAELPPPPSASLPYLSAPASDHCLLTHSLLRDPDVD